MQLGKPQLDQGPSATGNCASNLGVALMLLTPGEKLDSSPTFLLSGLRGIAAWIFSFFRVPGQRSHLGGDRAIVAFWTLAPTWPERFFASDLIVPRSLNY